MLYLEYERLRSKYATAREVYDSILAEKEAVFQLTQPRSTMGEYEREHDKSIKVGSGGGQRVNQIEQYVITIEQKRINERLAEAKSILNDRLELLQQMEMQLRKDKRIDNQLYVMRFIDRMKVKRISAITRYSEPQIYRRLRSIKEKIKDDKK